MTKLSHGLTKGTKSGSLAGYLLSGGSNNQLKKDVKMAANKGAPASRGAKALKNWLAGRFDTVRQKYRGEWFSVAKLVTDGVIDNIALAGEFIAWMRNSREGRYAQKGTNGSAQYRIIPKEELLAAEERAHAVLVASRPAVVYAMADMGSGGTAPGPTPIVTPVQDSLSEIGPSPAIGIEYSKLAEDPTVVALVHSLIPAGGRICFVDLHKAMKQVPGWNKATDQGFGRMLGKMARHGHVRFWIEGYDKLFAHPKADAEPSASEQKSKTKVVRKAKLESVDHTARIAELEAEVSRLQDQRRTDENARIEQAIADFVSVLKPLDNRRQDAVLDRVCKQLGILGLNEYEEAPK